MVFNFTCIKSYLDLDVDVPQIKWKVLDGKTVNLKPYLRY